jgi:hypothetical protein
MVLKSKFNNSSIKYYFWEDLEEGEGTNVGASSPWPTVGRIN